MFEEVLYAWLAVRLAVSVGLGVRAAGRLRHDETSPRAFAWVARLHVLGAIGTWVLEVFARLDGQPPLPAQAAGGAFMMTLLYTAWVPLVDALVFVLVTGLMAVLLVQRRLARYRDDLLVGEPDARVRAARACEFLGRLASPAVPELVAVTADPDPDLRYQAVRALAVIPLDDPEAFAALRRAATDPDRRVRMAAGCAACLHDLGPDVRVPEVVAALTAEDDDLKRLGVKAVEVLGPAALPAVPALVTLANHWKLGGPAIGALGAIGPAARDVLIRLMEHADPSIRDSADLALARMEVEEDGE